MFTLLLTCEHASNAIPKNCQSHFNSAAARHALTTHAGIDLGALRLARALERCFGVQLYAGKVSRLLIELNRSAHHPKLWSKFSQTLSASEKQHIVQTYYTPHRDAVTEHIRRAHTSVLHLGVHSFTPSLDGHERTADIGLLYDPQRTREQAVCKQWQTLLEGQAPDLCVRRNYPYRGNTDGLTTSLRRQFAASRYLGIELEVNQARLVGTPAQPERIARIIYRTLHQVLTG